MICEAQRLMDDRRAVYVSMGRTQGRFYASIWARPAGKILATGYHDSSLEAALDAALSKTRPAPAVTLPGLTLPGLVT